MKKIKFIYTLGVLAMSISLFSCSRYLDVNQTPNNPESVPPNLLLPTVTYGIAFNNANEFNRFASTIMQYQAGAAGSPFAYDRYNIAPENFNNQWNTELYGGSMVAAQELIAAAKATNSPVYAGIAKIQLAYAFSVATDIWGDVPYSDALKGKTGVTQPAFDSQETIYKGGGGVQSLFDLVREGLNDLNETSVRVPGAADDRVYSGNLANWRRFGNSLLLKFAMQISRREPALATTVINQVIASGNYIVDNTQNFAVPFGTANGSNNPIFTYTRVSLFAPDLIVSRRYNARLLALNDPRRTSLILIPATVGGVDGTLDNGDAAAPPALTARLRFGNYVTGAAGEGAVRLMTASQVHFMLAEAVVRLGVTVPGRTANDLYREGIRLSMADVGVAPAAITAYFTANPAVVTLSGTPAAQIGQIITQKYIALSGNGVEAFNDWRRTGFPVLAVSQNAAGEDGTIPVRLPYPPNELERNPKAPNPGPRANVRVWWDVD